MATKWLEPGGDGDFLNPSAFPSLWANSVGSPTIATDFVHGDHIKSDKYVVSSSSYVLPNNNTVRDAGTRMSIYIYLNAMPAGTSSILVFEQTDNVTVNFRVRITSGGVLQLWNSTAQIGSNGSTLSTGIWYRLCIAYTITSTTVNRFELFKDAVSDISVTNATLASVTSGLVRVGNSDGTSMDLRTSDHYIDDSSSLTDTGDIWVTAKRPFANGTTNGFTTQIGAGGSGYGTGHSSQVNERALSETNGWSMVGAGSAVTEEYNIESKSTGDINISTATIVDWVAWADMKSAVAETVQFILDGANNAQAITTSHAIYMIAKGSATYPAGTGADIGITTDTSITTVSLYECGILVAYIPSSTPVPTLLTLGVGI